MSNDKAMQTLQEYLEDTNGKIFYLLSPHQFEEVSINRWVVSELMREIQDHPFDDAGDSVDNFALKLMAFRTMSEGLRSERLFSIASEAALEWSEYFNSSGGIT